MLFVPSQSYSHLPTPLFLDFDGVLHPPGQGHAFLFLPAFEDAVRKSPRLIQIIVSSTCRLSRTLTELKAPFSPDVAALITDVTPNLGSGSRPAARHDEVMAWLGSKSRQGQPWVGIDDQPRLYRPGAALVECRQGFGPNEGERLIEAIGDPAAFSRRHPVRCLPTPRAGLRPS